MFSSKLDLLEATRSKISDVFKRVYLVLEVVDEGDLHANLMANFIKTFFLPL
jgi:hypothetical protein